MSSIAEALKRAQQERDRLKGHSVRPSSTPAGPRSHSLAGVVLRKESPPPVLATPAPAAPISAAPISAALRQAPPPEPTVAQQTAQRTAETIVEDYNTKRNLHLPHTIAVYHDRAGPIADEFRKVRDHLLAQTSQKSNAKADGHAFVLTSAAAGEGKTATLLNLGLSLVEVPNQRVLLIDGCLHTARPRGTLTNLLHLHNQPGLAELLVTPVPAAAPAALDPSVQATPWHHLYLLPAGARTTAAAAAELLQAPMLRAALRQFRAHFNWILIDSPPAGLFPDAGLLSAPADGILLALALHRTPREEVQSTLRRLGALNLSVKSCILTRA